MSCWRRNDGGKGVDMFGGQERGRREGVGKTAVKKAPDQSEGFILGVE